MVINEVLRWVTLALSAIGVAAWLRWMQYDCEKRTGYALMVILWLAHVMVFNMCAILGCLGPAQINLWSQAVRLQGVISLLGAGFVLWKY